MKKRKHIIHRSGAFSLWTHRAEGGEVAQGLFVPRAEPFYAGGAGQWSVIVGGAGRVEAWFIHLKGDNMIQLDGCAGRPAIHGMGRRAA